MLSVVRNFGRRSLFVFFDRNIIMDLIETGKIVNTHGVRGEVKIYPWTSDLSRLLEFEEFFIDGESYSIESIRVHKDMLIVKFKGIDSVKDSEKLRNKIVKVDASLFKLDDGEYFLRDLLGMVVYDADTGVCYGKITDIFQPGANDVYEISEIVDGKSIKRYIPAIKDCIIKTDIDNKVMTVRPLEGLFDL